MAEKVWNNGRGFSLSGKITAQIKRALRGAGEWAVTNQVRHSWPAWDANLGRFPAASAASTGKVALSIAWNAARMAQGLLSAAAVLGKDKDTEAMREAAELALFQDMHLQIYDPEYPELRGAIREETPLCYQINPRDGMECSQGWLMKAWSDGKTADPIWMARTKDQLSWTVRYLMNRPEWPAEYVFFGMSADEKSGQFPRQFSQKKKVFREPQSVLNFYLAAVGIPLAQYVAKTGDRTLLSRQVWKTADWLVANLIDPKSGALRTPGKALGHHADELGGVKGLLSNDDGVIISLLCLDRMRPKTSWREAAFKNAEWWLGLKEQPKLFAAIPATMLLMLDMARLTGKVEYLDWVLERLEGVLALQDWGKNPMSRGAFLGEDGNRMPNWLGAPPEQCTCLRLTSYVTIALSKLIASEKTWSPAYSCFGW